MKVNVINPTDKVITVSIEGVEYSVEGKGKVEVEKSHADYWVGKLHQFLLVEEVSEKAEPKKEEEKKEEKKEKKEDKKVK